MDPLSISASIIALLQVTSTVIGSLSDVKGDLNELKESDWKYPVTSLYWIMLQDQADQAKQDDTFSSTLMSLNVPDGPITQSDAAIENLASKLAPIEDWRKIRKAFEWQLEKDEIHMILETTE